MEKDCKNTKEVLEQQLQWVNQNILILDEIESKLILMKKIAEYAAGNQLAPKEVGELSERLNKLKKEISLLEKCLQLVIH